MSELLPASELPPVDPLPTRLISALRGQDGVLNIFGGHHTYELYCRMGVESYEIVRSVDTPLGQILHLKPVMPTR